MRMMRCCTFGAAYLSLQVVSKQLLATNLMQAQYTACCSGTHRLAALIRSSPRLPEPTSDFVSPAAAATQAA